MAFKKEYFSLNVKRVILYYLLYCILFIILDLIFVSVFTFFHFLLEHDMNTIENWLNRNTWEILSLSKIISLLTTAKITKLNFVEDIRYRDFLTKTKFIPTLRIWGVIFFILIIFYAFITLFDGGLIENQFKKELFYSSFLGSFCFYTSDFLMIYLLAKVYPIKIKERSIIMYICLLFFILASKVALPYLNKYYVFLMVHFMTMYILSHKDHLPDIIVYGLFVIAPLSSLYGFDIVWDNAYSLFSYQKPIPAIGIFAIWGVAISYYHLSRAD